MEPTEHKPCRFLGNPDLFSKLHGRDTLAGPHEQIHGVEPLMQGDMRPLEDGSGANRKVNLAGVAAVKTLPAWSYAVAACASWAYRAVRPQSRLKVCPRRILIGEHLEKLECADCALTHGFNLLPGSVPAPAAMRDAPLTQG